MNPKVIAVKEGRAIDAAGRVATVLNVSYTVGSFGPFTLVTSAGDLANGNAMRQMQQFAASLGQLPVT